MTPPPPPRSPRREQLLDAALARFSERGVAETRIEDVTAEAGVAKGTFYLYFRSKDEVLEALRERFLEGMVAMTTEAAASLDTDDPWERIDAFVANVIAYDLDDPVAYELLLGDGTTDPDLLERCVAVETAAIARGRDAGVFWSPDPAASARFLFHGVEGLIRDHLRRGGDREALVATAQQLVRRVLRPG